jgi:hypothetical protein
MSPPLTPDADEARRQLAEELSKPIYTDVQNWLSDQFHKLLDWLAGDRQATGTLSSGQLAAVGLGIAVIAAVAIWAVMGPLRTERRRRTAAVLADEERTAAQLRADAAALAASDAWGEATVQLFRALVRSLGERAVIEETPGMTAHEAAGRAGVRLPGLAERLARGADVFDALAYGRRPGSRGQYESMRALDDEVAAARPAAPAGEPSPLEVEVS